MASRRYWNWEDDDLTFDLSQWLVGILQPGVYRGFDIQLEDTASGMTVRLSHSRTGAIRTLLTKEHSVAYGVLVTKQGIVFACEDNIVLPVNSTMGSGRKDIIVFEHSYERITGGIDGEFKIIQGVDGDISFPELTNPNLQTVIGTLDIPANVTKWSDAGTSNGAYSNAYSLSYSGGARVGSPIFQKPAVPEFASNDVYVKRQGGFLESDLDANGRQIRNLQQPLNNSDAATKIYVDNEFAAKLRSATETTSGIAMIATQAEITAGTNDSKFTTPLKLKSEVTRRTASLVDTLNLTGENLLPTKWLANLKASLTQFGLVKLASDAETQTGTDSTKAVTPHSLMSVLLLSQTFDIGTWNLTASQTKDIAVSASTWWNKVVAADAMLYNDNADSLNKYAMNDSGTIAPVDIKVSATTIQLRVASGTYTDYDGTTGNRGYVTVWKKLDIAALVPTLKVVAGNDWAFTDFAGQNTMHTVQLQGFADASGSAITTMVWSVLSGVSGYSLVQDATDSTRATFSFNDFGQYQLQFAVTLASGLKVVDTLNVNYVSTAVPVPVANLRIQNLRDFSYLSNGQQLTANIGWPNKSFLALNLDTSGSLVSTGAVSSGSINYRRFERRIKLNPTHQNEVTDFGSWEVLYEILPGNSAVSYPENITQSATYQYRTLVRNTFGGESAYSTPIELGISIINQPDITFTLANQGSGTLFAFNGLLTVNPRGQVITKVKIAHSGMLVSGINVAPWPSQANTRFRVFSANPNESPYTGAYADLKPSSTNTGQMLIDIVNQLVTLPGQNTPVYTRFLSTGDNLWVQGNIALGTSTSASWSIDFTAYGAGDVVLKTLRVTFGEGGGTTITSI